MYPYQRTPMGNPYIRPIARGYLWVISSPRIPNENTINTMGTRPRTLGVHPSLSLDSSDLTPLIHTLKVLQGQY